MSKKEEKDHLNSSFDNEEFYDKENPNYEEDVDLTKADDKPTEGFPIFPSGLQIVIAVKCERRGKGDVKSTGPQYSSKTNKSYNYTFELCDNSSPKIFDAIYYLTTKQDGMTWTKDTNNLNRFGLARLKNFSNAVGFNPSKPGFNADFLLFKPVKILVVHGRDKYKEMKELEKVGCSIDLTEKLNVYDEMLTKNKLKPILKATIKEYFPLASNEIEEANIAAEVKKNVTTTETKSYETKEEAF